jgi:hypothetical protein
MKRMKRFVLVVLALLALLPAAQLVAQAPPVATPSVHSAAPPAPDLARFLATLPGAKAQAPIDSAPAPLFMTGCSPACSGGQICCFLCGNIPADGDTSGCYGCITPYKGRCPLVA